LGAKEDPAWFSVVEVDFLTPTQTHRIKRSENNTSLGWHSFDWQG